MITTSIARFIVPAAMLLSPVAASAQQQAPAPITQVAENTVASVASAPSASVSTGTPAAVPVAEKKVCKMLPSSFSHMNTRTCLTAKQWKQVETNDQ